MNAPATHNGGKSHERTASSTPLRVLVVDDNKDSASSLAMLLEMLGNDVRIAHDGEQALTVADEFRPDVVLLDIGLPRMDGYGAAQKLREQAWAKGVLLIAVTGWGQDSDRSREAGFDHHLVKPVDPSTLVQLLRELEAARSPGSAALN